MPRCSEPCLLCQVWRIHKKWRGRRHRYCLDSIWVSPISLPSAQPHFLLLKLGFFCGDTVWLSGKTEWTGELLAALLGLMTGTEDGCRTGWRENLACSVLTAMDWGRRAGSLYLCKLALQVCWLHPERSWSWRWHLPFAREKTGLWVSNEKMPSCRFWARGTCSGPSHHPL